MEYYGHTAELPDGSRNPDKRTWQLLRDHLRNVAERAKKFAQPLGLANEAELAGLLHDLGKYSERFQARLCDDSIHGVNHWAAGAVQASALKHWATAFAIDGHHTGLPSLDGADGFKQTVIKVRDYKLRTEFTRCRENLDELLKSFTTDGFALPDIKQRAVEDRFAEAMRTRFLFSCLVDADFLDTENHFDPSLPEQRTVPVLNEKKALQLLRESLERKSSDGGVNQLRNRLLTDCLSAAENSPGLFTLTAPTGSGKTLASLAFALKHIEHHNAQLAENDPNRFRRVIVVIPYTSIIEQTAKVYRELFESAFGPDYVLEHHSAIAPREQNEDKGRDAENERLRRARLAAENWASPLVVTTSVRFFESLFAYKPSACRKLHNIGRSVVLFDEVQTLPPRLVPSLLSAVRLLVRDYGVSAMFMTATQPAFASAGKALPYGWEPKEVSSDPNAMAEALCRTRIELPAREGKISWDELATLLAKEPQALCVLNTTKDARNLFRLLPPDNRFHLSSRLCPAHRQEKLELIRQRLKNGEPVRLISTQLIEAGVDVDFPIAFRAMGPLDSIIQTAGRCNREGRHLNPCPVIVFRPMEGGTPRGAYEIAAKKTESFLDRFPDAQSRLHRPDFYAAYFTELYPLLGPKAGKKDDLFEACEKLDFPKAAEECQLVGEDTRAVLVKWKDGNDLVEKLVREKHLTREECRLAQRFSVNLYEGEFQQALAQGFVYQPVKDWDFWVWNSKYDDDMGACHPKGDDFLC